MKKLVIKYLIVMVGLGLAVAIFAFIILYGLYKEIPQASEVLNYRIDTASEVYDANGRLIHMYAFEHRKLVDIADVPQHFIQMLLEVEDANFYNHWGVDLPSVLRAAYVNLRRGRTSQGASTISQQLARNMFLSTERVYSRKIKEIMLAIMIEKQFTKQEILESYINKVLFGNGYYGIETASMNYFLKKSSDLSVPESALLVGLLRGSGYYNPILHPDRALARRNLVLEIAREKGVLTNSQYGEAIHTPLNVNRVSVVSTPTTDYFVEYIRLYLERKYGTMQLFTGGLKIFTTIDYDMQQYADSVMNAVLANFDEERKYRNKYSDVPENAVNITTDYLQGGVFAIDPNTGYVKVMIGGRNFQHSKFNRVMQARRQPGSSFKPFVYAAALENGFTASTVVSDEPLVFMKGNQKFWEPKNYTRDYRGNVRLRDAIKLSLNIVSAKVIYDITPEKVMTLIDKMNFSTKIEAFLSLSVGSCEVIPYELVTAFTIFPGKGDLVQPIFVTKVTDSKGKVLEQANTFKRKVLDPKHAYVMTDMMQSVVNEGTAASIRTRGLKSTLGGKTGTTDDYRDAWFVGFSKDLVMGTWVGFDDNRSMGRSMTGGVAALPIWIPIMKYYEDKQIEKGVDVTQRFDMPRGVVRLNISKETGLLPTAGEPTITEVFVEYTEPRLHSGTVPFNYYHNTHFITAEDHTVNLRY